MQPNDQQPAEYPQQTQPVPVAPPAEYPQQPVMADPNMQETTTSTSDLQTEQPEQLAPSELPQIAPVVWQDIEYIQHDKNPLWYVGFVIVIIILIAGAVLLQAWTFIPLIIVMAVALVIYTHRPPRLLNYSWSAKGLTINDQLHPAGEFKSFGILQDGAHNAIVFIPVKRFRPGLTVYFPAEVGEELVDAVGAYLPMQDLHLDAFDKIIRKLRI
jgi:hypothetical protein